MLKYYDMNVHYHPDKDNVVANALSRMSMGNSFHVENMKKELSKEVCRLARLGLRLVDSSGGGVSVHPSSESSLVVEVKEGQHLDHVLMDLKDSMLVKMNETFSLGDYDILRFQDRLCVRDVDDLQTKIIVETHGYKYSIHLGSTNMYHDLKQIYWWDGMKKDIADYVAKFPNYQQVKAEPPNPGSLT